MRNKVVMAKKHLVILVHGILSNGTSHPEVRQVLRDEGFTVELTNFGLFGLLRFLSPFKRPKRKAADEVWKQIQLAVNEHSDAEKISVIAHSFGTFIVGSLVQREPLFKVNKIIFCGSVLRRDFDFANFAQKFEAPILNEIGTKDFWPALAESVTWGYGSAGTYGFRQPLFEDRWHDGVRHTEFNNREFCRKYWVPFLLNGEVVEGAPKVPKVSFYVKLIRILPLKWMPLIAFAVFSVLADPDAWTVKENATIDQD